LITW
jgi:hypothetical protein